MEKIGCLFENLYFFFHFVENNWEIEQKWFVGFLWVRKNLWRIGQLIGSWIHELNMNIHYIFSMYLQSTLNPFQPLWLHWFLSHCSSRILLRIYIVKIFFIVFHYTCCCYVVFIYYSFGIEQRNKSLSDPFASIEKFFFIYLFY